jgi:hypothetical protein
VKLNDVERSAAENTGESVNTRSGSNFVWGDLGYLVPMRERAFQTMFEPPPGRLATNCAFDMRRLVHVVGRDGVHPARCGVKGGGFL